MAKTIRFTAEVDTTPLTVQVTGAPGSAGVAVSYTTASSNVTVTNTSGVGKVQYKIDSGNWNDLERQAGILLPLDFSVSALYLRRATFDGGGVSVDLSIDGVPTLKSGAVAAPTIVSDTSGNPSGLLAPGGKPISVGGGYKPAISQYDRALILPQIRQANAVKGLSRNINDAQYIGPITDAEVYDTEAGALSVGQATTKALAFPWGKTLWDLANGESLLIQARVKTVAATTSSNVLFGNSDATWEGFSLVMYGPTHATNAGKLFFNFKANGTGAQAIQLQPAVVAGASVSAVALATDTYYNITIHVDGATRRLDSWVNCQQSLNASTLLNAGSTVPAAKHNFGLGYIPSDDGFTATTAKAARFQAFRMAVLPAGMKFVNPGLLDLHFNVNPYRLFNDTDYVGGA